MEKQCSQQIWWDDWHQGQCSKSAVVERGGKVYCKIHDPEYIKQKGAKRETKRKALACPKCENSPHYPYWKYCPLCGTEYPSKP